MSKSIKRNFIYNVLLNISSVIFPLITAPYVSRVLEPDGVGVYNFSNTYAGYFALVALLGIPTYGVREVARLHDDKDALTNIVSQLMSIAFITTLIVSIAYIITIIIIGQLTENYIIFVVAGFAIYLTPFKVNWYYQGIEEFGFITFRSLIIRTISVICLFIFVREKNDLIVYVIINAFGNVLSDIWNYLKMINSGIKPRFTLKGLKQHFNPLLLLFASSIAISIYTVLDTIMLGFIKDYDEVGYYTNAMHMSKVIISAVTSLSIVAVPRVSYYMKNRDYNRINDLMNKSFSFVSFISFPAAIGLACISPTFIPLFFGVKFIGSTTPLMILSLLIISIGLSNLTGIQILIGMGFDKLFLYSVLVGTFSNFLLNCILIPLWGATGASVASVIAETLILIATTFFVYLRTPIRIDSWKNIFKALLGSLVFIPLIFVLMHFYNGWALIGLFVLLSTILYLFIESLLKNDSLVSFKEIIKQKMSL